MNQPLNVVETSVYQSLKNHDFSCHLTWPPQFDTSTEPVANPLPRLCTHVVKIFFVKVNKINPTLVKTTSRKIS